MIATLAVKEKAKDRRVTAIQMKFAVKTRVWVVMAGGPARATLHQMLCHVQLCLWFERVVGKGEPIYCLKVLWCVLVRGDS